MPRELIIIRHAKSDWVDGSLDDHERPLNDRGRRDAPRLAAELAARGVRPSAMLSSTAVRALTTARIFAGALGFPEKEILTSRRWYLAPPSVWLDTIRGLDQGLETVLIFGHNPGLEELADLLLRKPSAFGSLATCAVVRLRLPDSGGWSEVGGGRLELIEHLYPKAL